MKIADIEVAYVDHMGTDLSIVNAARVSFDKTSEWEYVNCLDDDESHEKFLQEGWEDTTDPDGWAYTAQRLKESDAKLIKYLAKHKHTSPFNHTFITVKVKAPIFVSRQLVKHKFMPWNEESRRYINTEPEFYIPPDYRLASENVKQGSSSDLIDPELLELDCTYEGNFGDTEGYYYSLEGVTVMALEWYNNAIKNGLCNEQARMVLTQNMMVNWIWSGTLGAMADMLVLRLDSHTQAETRIVAEKIRDIIMPLFPVSLAALLEST